jgi:hypothetical protein
MLRRITSFGNGALVSNHSERVVSIPESADLAHSPTDMSVDWIRANAVAALVSFVLGVATFGLRQMLGLPDPEAGAFARGVQGLAEIIAAVAGFAVYGVRTGAVLQRKLPRFPPLTWQTLHILMGLGVGIVVASLELQAESTPRENLTPSILSIAVGGMMIGAFMGAAAGALQALVLRKAAREVSDWIRWSALAGTTLGGYALALGIGSDQPLRDEVLIQLLGFAIAIAAGILMLPALLRLRPH